MTLTRLPGGPAPPLRTATIASAAAPQPTRPPPRLADRARPPPPPPSTGQSSDKKKKVKAPAKARPPLVKKAFRDPASIIQLAATPQDEADAAGVATLQAESGAASFAGLGLDERVLAALPDQGVYAPTPVQATGIPAIVSGRNVALHAPTGSGKTLAFLLPVLDAAIARAEAEAAAAEAALAAATAAGTKRPPPITPSLQAIIVSPSRELAMQTTRVAQRLLPDAARAWVQQCIGGANPHRQLEALKRAHPLVVIGTPGRLAELSRSGALQSHGAACLVLDEADQLLAPQFREEVGRLADHTGRKLAVPRQTILVSATLTPSVVARYGRWCPEPVYVSTSMSPDDAARAGAGGGGATAPGSPGGSPFVSAPAEDWGWGAPGAAGEASSPAPTTSSAGGGLTASTDPAPVLASTLTHAWLPARKTHRTDALRRALHALGAARALVFMNAAGRTHDTAHKLNARGVPAAVLHGILGKEARKAVLADFEAGRLRALVVSDVAARGLDFPGCDAVFNLELPTDAAHYAHRAGRTGRAGRPGVVVTLCEQREAFVVERLAKRLGVSIPEARLEAGRLEMGT